MESSFFNTIQSTINNDFVFKNENLSTGDIPSSTLNYDTLIKEIRQLITFTKNDYSVSNNHYSFFVFGKTGVGKSEIIENIAKEEGCVYHKLEIQKVPIEILQGFPYLSDIKTKQGEIKIAKLAPSTILPPSNDDRVWVLHLDEFNKADTDKMAAVMNLVLTGELGGSADYNEELGKSVKYKLPRKTIIIGSGNTKEQENIENLNVVSNMDTATSERWHRTGYLPYDAESWLTSYALKPYKFKEENLSTRIPGIILNYILDKLIETGDKASPFIIPIISGSESGVEGERTTSPRAWTLVSDMMQMQAYYDYKKEEREESFNDYFRNPEKQIYYLKNQVYEFGLKGDEIATDIISRYIYFAENRVLPADVLTSYLSVRDTVKKLKDKKGAILYLFLGIAYYINDLKKMNIKEYGINLSTFIEDCEIPSEDVVAFIQGITKEKNKLATEFNDFMISISIKYKEAYAGYYHTSIHEIK